MKHTATLHLVGLITMVLSLFQPVIDGTPSDVQTIPTGSLVISLAGSDGTSLGGACFDVLHTEGVVSVCDDDGDGSVTLAGVPAGDVTVRQTTEVAGYISAVEGYGFVPDGDTGYVSLTATPVPPAPTVAPSTEVPPTEEPTAIPPTEAPQMQARDFSLLAAGDISLTCNHDAGVPTTDFTVSVEDIPGDVADFLITVTPYDLLGNPVLPAITSATSPLDFPNVEWRRINVEVQFSDGTFQSAVAGCNADPIESSIVTSAETASGGTIPDGGRVDVGTAIRDTSVLEGVSQDATGTVTYYLYNNADCSGDPVFTSGPHTVENGIVPASNTFTPSDSGVHEWIAVYSGDLDEGNPIQNAHFNAPASSECGEETVIVGEVDTQIVTTMLDANNAVIPQLGTVPSGTAVKDAAVLNGATGDAGGTVTYTLYAGACPGTVVTSFEVDVTNGVVPTTDVVEGLAIGTYNWVAEYAGDEKNAPSTSGCGQETFSIGKAIPVVTTTMYTEDGAVIEDGDVVPVGTSTYDTTAISSFAQPLTGTVTYALYDSADCTGQPVAGPFEVTIGEDGTVPASPIVELNDIGIFNWVVTYSGNDRNESGISDCGSETVSVEPASPAITTEIYDAAGDAVVEVGSLLPAESSVYDTAVLDGATADASGTVTFYLYNNYTCTGDAVVFGPYDVSNGVVPPTEPTGALGNGTWNWVAEYSGDDRNQSASTACGDEQFFVGQGQGGVTTMVEDTNGTTYPDGSTVVVDTVLRDTAVLHGVTSDASGTVTFRVYQGVDCSGSVIFTSAPVAVENGVLAGPSGTFTFENQGTYQWVASYSGDAKNAAVASPCGAETIVVVGKPSSVTTIMLISESDEVIPNNGRVLAGTPVHDTAVVTPADATGTLTFRLYNNANCSGSPIQSFENLALGSPSPDVTLTTPGIYNWVVNYSGDADFAPSVSNCSRETFYIALQPIITTLMVDENGDEIPNESTLVAGDYIGDTSTLLGATGNAGGTVTYFFYNTADCSGTPVFAPQVRVTNGVVAPSGLVQPPFIGEWSIQAVYSGDNTNFPVTSECGTENFTVDPASEVLIWTTMRANNTVTPHNGEIRFLPAGVTDTVHLVGLPNQTTVDVVFELYKSADCSGQPVFTDAHDDFTVSASAWTLTSDSHALATGDWGLYNWVVRVTGDIDGDTIPDELISPCGSETFTGVTQNPRNVTIQCTYNSGTQLTTFRVLVSKPTTADPDIDPELVIVATPTDNLLNPLTPNQLPRLRQQ